MNLRRLFYTLTLFSCICAGAAPSCHSAADRIVDAGPADGSADQAAEAAAPGAFAGYTLFSPLKEQKTYLIDLQHRTVHSWTHDCLPASMPYLLSDGSILRPCGAGNLFFQGGGAGGRIQRIAWDGTLLWDYYYSSNQVLQHHDIEPMPNGNVLLIAWEWKTPTEAMEAGRREASREMWPLHIVEVKPLGASGGEIVWEWHIWDHLVQDADPIKSNYGIIAEHPERVDINYGSTIRGDWVHANHLDFHPERDEIVFSSHSFNEVYVIDHSTTTAEAASRQGGQRGKGGDLLYRWGNPRVHGAGTVEDQHFFTLHGANWIDAGSPGAGNILIFNNGDREGRDNDYSIIEEIRPPLDEHGNYSLIAGAAFGPEIPLWSYSDPGQFYSRHLAGAYRLENGNTLITNATTGHLFEINPAGTTVWRYDHPDQGAIARAMRYGVDHPGLARLAPTK